MRFKDVTIKHEKMRQNSTQDLLLLHLYNETTPQQDVSLARELANNESLQQERIELQETQALLNSKFKSPSLTSLRIIMEHSYKTERLQEI